MRLILLLLLSLALSAPALADDAAPETQTPERLGPEYCFDTDSFAKPMRKRADMKSEKRDRVNFHMPMSVWLEPSEAPPSHVEVRDAGSVTRFDFSPVHDNIFITPSLADALGSTSEAAQVCVVDPTREGRLRSERGYRGGLSMDVLWMSTPGTHDLADIEDGLKDGRSHYKKLAGAMAMLVPKFTHIAVRHPNRETPPKVFATRAGADVGEPEFEDYDGTRFVSVKAIEALGADAIRIDGPYEIGPSPSVKQVKRFTGG